MTEKRSPIAFTGSGLFILLVRANAPNIIDLYGKKTEVKTAGLCEALSAR
jgi:hypothetical protein